MIEEDPIVAEVRLAREQIAAECGYDLKTLFERLRRENDEARKAGTTVVALPPRPVERRAKTA